MKITGEMVERAAHAAVETTEAYHGKETYVEFATHLARVVLEAALTADDTEWEYRERLSLDPDPITGTKTFRTVRERRRKPDPWEPVSP